MPTRHQLTAVARNLKTRLGNQAFLTIPRMEITELVRQVSGEDSTRIKSGMADDLDLALLEQGIRCFPKISATTTGEIVRLFHAGTLLGTLVDTLIHPSTESDHDLGTVLTKIKGKWESGRQLHETVPASR